MSNGKEINIQLMILTWLATSVIFTTVNALGIISGVNLWQLQFKIRFTTINIKQITLQMHTKTHAGLHVKCLSVLYCCNNNWYNYNNTFVKLSCHNYPVGLSCYMGTGRHFNGHTV
jgi:hypothetical protein